MTEATRILTTHTGSLPPADTPQQARLQELLVARVRGQQVDKEEFAELADMAVHEVVGWQRAIGIDIVSSGELDRGGFMEAGRLAGWGKGPGSTSFRPLDLVEGGMIDWVMSAPGVALPSMNAGKVSHDPELIETEVSRLIGALESHGIACGSAFMPEPSPCTIAALGTVYYDDEQLFLKDVTGSLAKEYQAIAASGLTVQVDAPELMLLWFAFDPCKDVEVYLPRLRRAIEAINAAIDGIPREQVRVHTCHGNWNGPHTHDIELPQVIEELYQLNAGTLVIELANRRHNWERAAFREHPLPDGKMLAGGVIDAANLNVEHEITVADELTELATIVGADRLIASTDCGFRTNLGTQQSRYVAEAKLKALVAGARQATNRLNV